MPASLAPRTRLFATVLRRLAPEPADATEMIALRGRRDRLRDSLPGRLVFGRIAAGVVTSEHTVELAGGTQRLLVHRPSSTGEGGLPMVVNVHGGGWCLGAPEQSAWLASHVAAATGAVVVSPTYRLAPENPYPAAVEDSWAMLQWVVAHAAELGGDPARVAVMGDSAGGNLAAVCALEARDAGAPPLRAQVLIYPAVEMYESYPSEQEHAHAPVLTSTQMHNFGHLYLGERYGVEDWQASPLRAASHAGLPPALILTAGHDPLRDHGTRYAEALRGAGVAVDLRDYGPAIHGFLSLPGVVPVAKQALADIVSFLREQL